MILKAARLTRHFIIDVEQTDYGRYALFLSAARAIWRKDFGAARLFVLRHPSLAQVVRPVCGDGYFMLLDPPAFEQEILRFKQLANATSRRRCQKEMSGCTAKIAQRPIIDD